MSDDWLYGGRGSGGRPPEGQGNGSQGNGSQGNGDPGNGDPAASSEVLAASVSAPGTGTGRGADDVDMCPGNRTNLGPSCEPATNLL
jgi:hypothetical protein